MAALSAGYSVAQWVAEKAVLMVALSVVATVVSTAGHLVVG